MKSQAWGGVPKEKWFYGKKTLMTSILVQSGGGGAVFFVFLFFEGATLFPISYLNQIYCHKFEIDLK